ncbi:hypothetical protein N781_16105 [Pontibacillus halophilus JSM 076056 = DSM 19796]|uniref:Uncharacterized protein n=1 Tax=Pontibacillus halophilus JSM 076056 = DSM 19796 TaxID=1385510 RepID=A0A0A5I1K6_9BACI|nr:hypothetical protein [Pontibacillus halophilus]KGX89742.1 hypothetical protein N781_16105 [Pontibacillus halophilus JSM 076056 = DSM 19796]
MIASQPYVRVERKIENAKQLYSEVEESIELHEGCVKFEQKQFHIQHVYDLSVKRMAGRFFTLYVHTNQGVFTFNVHRNPDEFIEAFKQLKGTG